MLQSSAETHLMIKIHMNKLSRKRYSNQTNPQAHVDTCTTCHYTLSLLFVLIFILCTHAQQGYAFGRVRLYIYLTLQQLHTAADRPALSARAGWKKEKKE